MDRSFRLFIDEVMPLLDVEPMPDPTQTIETTDPDGVYAIPMEGMDAELGGDQLVSVPSARA